MEENHQENIQANPQPPPENEEKKELTVVLNLIKGIKTLSLG